MTTPEARPAERLTGRCEGCECDHKRDECPILKRVRDAERERSEEAPDAP